MSERQADGGTAILLDRSTVCNDLHSLCEDIQGGLLNVKARGAFNDRNCRALLLRLDCLNVTCL
jgi:hypothetical protein